MLKVLNEYESGTELPATATLSIPLPFSELEICSPNSQHNRAEHLVLYTDIKIGVVVVVWWYILIPYLFEELLKPGCAEYQTFSYSFILDICRKKTEGEGS